ncbi:hypothetical protein [Herbiconiux solani]|nr:hypothetical protein [Herbiconiux solani]
MDCTISGVAPWPTDNGSVATLQCGPFVDFDELASITSAQVSVD